MSEKKNIDRLFQEKFKDFEENPPKFIWDNIREELKEKKKRRVIPIWLRLSGVAAILVMGLLLGLYFINTNGSNNNPVITGKGTTQPQGAPLKTLPTDKSSGNDINAGDVYDRSERPTVNSNVIVDANANDTDINNAPDNTDTGESANKNASKGINSPSINPSYNKNAIVQDNNNKPNGTTTDASVQPNNTVVNNKSFGNKNTVKNSGVAAANKNSKSTNANQQNNAVANNQRGTAKNNAASGRGSKFNINSSSAAQNNSAVAYNSGTASGNKATGKVQDNSNATQNGLTQNNKAVANNSTSLKNNSAGTDINKADGHHINNTGVATSGTDKETVVKNSDVFNDPATAAIPSATINKDTPLAETAIAATDTVKPENELDKLLREKEAGKKEEKDKALAENAKTNKWNVKPQLAPVFYNSLSQGSPIDGQFAGNAKSYENDLSYGVGVNYALNNRITIRSGVNTLNLNYETQGVEFYASLNKSTTNVAARTNANIVVQNQGAAPNVTPNAFNENQMPSGTFNGSMMQKTGYVEVPVEMAYALLDKKFGIDIIGGVSTLFLNGNNVSVVSTQGYATNVGQAQNLNSIHFSTNVGVGFKYRFFKSFEANFEPMFKYQVNTFSRDAGNFKPYFIGLYSGISFSF